MHRLKRYSTLINAIAVVDPKTRIGIIRSAPDEFIKALLEIVINFLHGNIPVQPQAFKKLKRYKKTLRDIESSRQGSIKTVRRKLQQQKGGFISWIAGNAAKRATRDAVNTAFDTVEERLKGYVDRVIK